MEKELLVETPLGKMYARKSGDSKYYPGIYIELEKPSGEVECLAVVEYCNEKEKLQTVVYAENIFADVPTDIITYDFITEEE